MLRTKCVEKQGVLRSNGCWEANCAEEKRVLGSKVFQGEKRSRKQSVLRSKVLKSKL